MTSTATLTGPAAGYIRDADVNQLFDAWQKHGDARARELLVQRYLPFARRLARRFQSPRELLDDLDQVAGLGLVKAIDRFDQTRGVTFKSYAVPTILGEIKRYFRDSGWSVHVPRAMQERALKVEQARREIAAEGGRAPNFNELAQFLEMSVEDVLEAVEAAAAHHSISFETPVGGDGEHSTLGDELGQTDHGFEVAELDAMLGQAAAHLTERERRVLALRFVADKPQTEIAEAIGVSQMQVSRILRQTLGRLEVLMDSRLPAGSGS
jgi:RNA polymerase sigma-B factor